MRISPSPTEVPAKTAQHVRKLEETMTEMREYNVRCCCQPKKILGTLRLPTGLKHRDTIVVQEHWGPSWAFNADDFDSPKEPMTVVVHQVELREFGGPPWDNCEIAVYSDDRPIEFWRKICGFTEARRTMKSAQDIASECCSWWGAEGPGRIAAVTKAILEAQNDALETVATHCERQARLLVGESYGNAGGEECRSEARALYRLAAQIREM